VPREIDHAELLSSAMRERAEQRLLWLRDPTRAQGAGAAFTRLMSLEGDESLETAIRQRRYSTAELAQLPEVLAELARERAHRDTRGWIGGWLQKSLAIGSTQRVPAAALLPLVEPVQHTHSPSGPTEAWRALGVALEPYVRQFLELRDRAEHEAEQQRSKVLKMLPHEPAPEPGAPAPAPVEPQEPSTAALAERWLERTEDATHELSRWLIKHTELPSSESDLARLCVGLRAFHLDGLARPDRRFYRLATGARKLGFERDMNARMRGENAPALIIPQPLCLALVAPRDVRVMQPHLEYGVLSDLSVAQGLGQGLALALASPALGPLLTRARGASVSAALGGLFVQLRADPEYLRRVDAFERDAAEKVARVAAIWLLLRARLAAALTLTQTLSPRTTEERVQQLSAAGERALGFPVPTGMLALALLAEESPQQQLDGLHWGFELHALLRERYDRDFYLNPRLSEVLRGAAARGAELSAADLASELGSRGTVALARLFELLG
jgi:hypothetical protein